MFENALLRTFLPILIRCQIHLPGLAGPCHRQVLTGPREIAQPYVSGKEIQTARARGEGVRDPTRQEESKMRREGVRRGRVNGRKVAGGRECHGN